MVAFALLIPLRHIASGQGSFQAQIRGIVTDSSGAVVTNANVTLTEVATNVSRTTKTDSSGLYILRALGPSTYVLRVEAPGFKAIKQRIVLQVDQETSLNSLPIAWQRLSG